MTVLKGTTGLLMVLLAVSACGSGWAQESKGTHRKVRVVDESATAIHDAEAAMEKQDFATAEKKLVAITTSTPEDYRGWFDLGYVYSATNRKDKAIEAYRKSIAAQAGVLEPNLNLALLLVEKGEPEAGRYLRAAGKLKPTPEVQKRIVRGWTALGDTLESKDHAGAVDAYQQAIELSPADPYPHLALGRLYENAKDSKAAEREYKSALAADADSGDALALLSNLYMRDNRPADAEATLREYVKKQPQSENAHLQLGRVLAKQDKHEDAIEEFEKALQLAPTDADAQRALAAAQLKLKQYDKGVATLKVLLAKEPNDPELHYALADALLHAKQYQAAQDEFMATAKLKPGWADPYGGLAISASEAKNYELAIRALDARSKLTPDTPPTFFLRATCYDHLGAKKEASVFYKEFLKVAGGKFPDEEWQARHRLIAIDPETRKKAK
jgi:tetratricopeptide (TPR) repeat protein